jgi:hypothetical protein
MERNSFSTIPAAEARVDVRWLIPLLIGWHRRYWSEREPFYAKTASDFRLNRVTPQVDRDWVRGKNSKLPIHKLSPRFVVGRRNRRQQGKSGGNRCPECAGKAIPGDFELPELVHETIAKMSGSDGITVRVGWAAAWSARWPAVARKEMFHVYLRRGGGTSSGSARRPVVDRSSRRCRRAGPPRRERG